MAGNPTVRGAGLTGLLVCMALAGTAAAQAPVQSIGLGDALKTTLAKAPVIQLARENVNAQEATKRVASGAFDATLRVAPLFEHREDRVTGGSLQQEQLKRALAKGLGTAFGKVADGLDEQLKDGRADLPICPVDGDFSLFVVTLPGTTLPVPLCRPASVSLSVQTPDDLNAASGLTASDLFRRPRALDPMAIFEMQKKLAEVFSVSIGVTALDTHERGFELLNQLREIARDVEMRGKLICDGLPGDPSTFCRTGRLGLIPDFQYSNTASIVGQFTKPLRNGTILQLQGTFDGRGAFYRGKPIDPTFAGRDVTNRFRSKLEAFWVQPLKRGRGAETVRASERAADKNAEATRFTYQQTAADQAVVVADAYFDLMAAQEALAANEESLQTQRRTLEVTIKLVGAGETARADLARTRARASEVEADVLSSRLDVVNARTQLATAMGLTPAEAATMKAIDVFPARPVTLDAEVLARQAVSRRADVHAATAFRDTSRILAAAARADTRSRFDLTVNGGFGEAYYGPVYHSIEYPGERWRTGPGQVADPAGDSYFKYYNAVGVARAFSRRWEPVAAISAVIELPFRNNARLGRLAQARASVTESEVRLTDLSRVIDSNVAKGAEQIRRARLEWEQRQEAVIQYSTTWDGAQRLRAAGEMTMIDMLLTEQQLTQARLQLVQAKRNYASAVARFKRETGTLLNFTGWAQAQPDITGIVATR